MSKTVLVPNLPTRWDAAMNLRVPSMDLNPAANFGELLCATMSHVDSADMNARLNEVHDAVDKLEADDLILLIGDPILCAAAVMYACDRFGSFKVLRWDRQRRVYDIVEVS